MPNFITLLSTLFATVLFALCGHSVGTGVATGQFYFTVQQAPLVAAREEKFITALQTWNASGADMYQFFRDHNITYVAAEPGRFGKTAYTHDYNVVTGVSVNREVRVGFFNIVNLAHEAGVITRGQRAAWQRLSTNTKFQRCVNTALWHEVGHALASVSGVENKYNTLAREQQAWELATRIAPAALVESDEWAVFARHALSTYEQ